jgi:hypothetical protein
MDMDMKKNAAIVDYWGVKLLEINDNKESKLSAVVNSEEFILPAMFNTGSCDSPHCL